MKLRACLIQLVLCCLLVGCFSLGPIWAPSVEGRVVDARTGAPIAGAEVFASYTISKFNGHSDSWTRDVPADSAFATTDDEGHFSIPAHLAVHPVNGGCATQFYPDIMVYHPDYGSVQSPLNVNYPHENELKKKQFWWRLYVEIEPRKRQADVSFASRVVSVMGACDDGDLLPRACERLCEVSVGIEHCARVDEYLMELEQQRRAKTAEEARRGPPITIQSDGAVFQRPRISVPGEAPATSDRP